MLFLRPTEPASAGEPALLPPARGRHSPLGRPARVPLHCPHGPGSRDDRKCLRGEYRRADRQNGRARDARRRSAPGRVALPMTPAQTDLWIAANMGTGASLELQPLLRHSCPRPADPRGAARGAARPGGPPRGPANDLRRARTLPVHLGPDGGGRAVAGRLGPAARGGSSRARRSRRRRRRSGPSTWRTAPCSARSSSSSRPRTTPCC